RLPAEATRCSSTPPSPPRATSSKRSSPSSAPRTPSAPKTSTTGRPGLGGHPEAGLGRCRVATPDAVELRVASYTSRMPIPALDLDKLTRDEKLQLIDAH